jgi:para-aminobenzoate synthetase component 1
MTSPPRTLAAQLAQTQSHFVWLHSGSRDRYTGGRSILAWDMQEELRSDDWDAFAAALSCDREPWENGWFGYLGYELKHGLETLPRTRPGKLALPPLWMMRFGKVAVFEEEGSCQLQATSCKQKTDNWQLATGSLHTQFTPSQHAERVERIRRYIAEGDLFQANLTQKWWQEGQTPDPFALFLRLQEVSPAPYSAYLRMGETHLLSSSPECFLTLDGEGRAMSRPIKGTARRGETPEQDAAIVAQLQASAKDRAENLMIVDLVRNDLARHCIPGSVAVERLCEVMSYPQLHHLVSTVTGQKRADVSSLDLVKGCFPPGSMTGAPKIRAMERIAELEELDRGVYSGAIGWFGGDGSLDLSVAIRTLILQPNYLEFQTGGAITWDSTPQGEWEEMKLKAQGMLRALR